MPSPFPGMDPYLDGAEWQSFHGQLAPEIARQLSPQLLPKYFAHTVQRTVYADPDEIGIAASRYPDVSVFRTEANGGYSPERSDAFEPLVLTTVMPEAIPQISVEIRDSRDRQLVTAIELLSPASKVGRGYSDYLQKRDEILLSTAHLLEIDLLSQGRRVPMREPLPPAAYYVFLSRADRRPRTQTWPIQLRDRLPKVPVPLLPGDTGVALDLQAAFNTVHEVVGYRYTIDYSASPPVALSEADRAGTEERLRAAGLR